MFTTWVMMCVLGASPEKCIEFQDQYGPYRTEEQCYDRAVEAAAALGSFHSKTTPNVPVEFSYKCELQETSV